MMCKCRSRQSEEIDEFADAEPVVASPHQLTKNHEARLVSEGSQGGTGRVMINSGHGAKYNYKTSFINMSRPQCQGPRRLTPGKPL